MEYRKTCMLHFEEDGVSSDFWTGNLHLRQREDGLFGQDTTLGFGLFTDGVQVFKMRVSFGVWPIVLVNYSLPPEFRYHEENLIIAGVIPGPKEPKNLNSFLYPLVEEFSLLQTGVDDVFNAHTIEKFTLRAHICLVGADQKGREKIMGTCGVPSYAYCPYCFAHGFRGPNFTYCPYNEPTDMKDTKGIVIQFHHNHIIY